MGKSISRGLIALTILGAILFAADAEATNGMNLEGYGPISASMGGASFAFNNGTAAMMNNPATLSLIPRGIMFDLALGSLGPNVTASLAAMSLSEDSEATAFYMPAFGIFMRQEKIGFGIGAFSQGGMGTEYNASSWLSDPSMGANTALDGGLVNRSEVGVGRVIVPVTYQVNEQLSVGLSFDFVWAGMDLQMALSEAQFQDLANPMAQTLGTASGSLVDAFGQLYEPFGAGTGIATLHHAYFDFSDGSAFTGEAKGYGVAGKLGVVYAVNEMLTIGGTYHSTTFLGDLETDCAKLSMGLNADPGAFVGSPTGNYEDMIIPLEGSVTVKDFEWPWVIGGGVSVTPNERVMIAVDLKYIAWSSVMEDFSMTFKADDIEENGGFAGLEMDATLFQEWENQLVFALGGAFDATEALTLRGGFNYGKNPVPDSFLNALFPAIVESHLTFGAGYDFENSMALNGSIQYGFEKEASNPGNGTTIPEVTSTHSQLNWMLMFSYAF